MQARSWFRERASARGSRVSRFPAAIFFAYPENLSYLCEIQNQNQRHTRMKKSVYLSALFLTGAAFQASAVPAIRTPFTVEQPDGTTVTVTLSGDERAHMMRTADGFPIVWDDARGYVFASIQPDGSLQPTTLRAADPSARNAETVSFLNEITPARLEAAGEMMARRAALSSKSRPMRTAAASRSSRHRGPGLSLTTFPSTGSPRSLIILAEYQIGRASWRERV